MPSKFEETTVEKWSRDWDEREKLCVCALRTETFHQLKRTRFDGVAGNKNGRIGVQFRGRKMEGEGFHVLRPGELSPVGGRFLWGFGVGGWMHVKSKTLILKRTANGALDSKQYNERGNFLLFPILNNYF